MLGNIIYLVLGFYPITIIYSSLGGRQHTVVSANYSMLSQIYYSTSFSSDNAILLEIEDYKLLFARKVVLKRKVKFYSCNRGTRKAIKVFYVCNIHCLLQISSSVVFRAEFRQHLIILLGLNSYGVGKSTF